MRLRVVITTLMAAAVMALAPPAAGGQGWGPATPNFSGCYQFNVSQ